MKFSKLVGEIDVSVGEPLLVVLLSEACEWRARTFYEKEPHTIRWLNKLGEGDVLWDIGANIGLYSMYAARRGAKVVAFEPMIPNLYALFVNVGVNELADRVTIVPAAMSDEDAMAMVKLHLSSPEIGSSCHSAGAAVNYKLEEKQFAGRHEAFVVNPSRNVWPDTWKPTHVKIDVDGLEHKVLRGLEGINTIRSMIVELNGNLAEHRAAIDRLTELGWAYDPVQWEEAKRKDGAFKGVGECIFARVS